MTWEVQNVAQEFRHKFNFYADFQKNFHTCQLTYYSTSVSTFQFSEACGGSENFHTQQRSAKFSLTEATHNK